MKLLYLLLSPTFGMHQYTADLANRSVQAGHSVDLVTTRGHPEGRYHPQVQIQTPVETRDTGLSFNAFQPGALRAIYQVVRKAEPDLIHLTGPHLWNLPLLLLLRRMRIPAVHTIHDMDPHPGTMYGPLLYVWNRWVLRWSHHILVHGESYRARLLDKNVAPDQVTTAPLLHGFWGWDTSAAVKRSAVDYDRFALFFGRFVAYKGIDVLLEAFRIFNERYTNELQNVVKLENAEAVQTELPKLRLAGQGNLDPRWQQHLPGGVEVRQRRIEDAEALDLFRRCSIVTLPYIQATQSALIAAAYVFRKPVIVTNTGALAEYVVPGETGWIVAPGDPVALADAFVQAFSDTARLRAMGDQGRVWYETQRKKEWEVLQSMYEQVAASQAGTLVFHQL